MTVNIISTANGLENEGMRNIATHVIRHGEGLCRLRRSSLSNPVGCVANTVGADAVVIFARASAKTERLASLLRAICPRVYFVLVQRPERGFMDRVQKKRGRYSYFAISKKDGDELLVAGNVVHPLPVGIDREKFHLLTDSSEKKMLRKKYGFDERPLVLHVGHLSRGRGLEMFLSLPGHKYNRLVVASGMFTDERVKNALVSDGVSVTERYIDDIGEVYRMADVYLFPTSSAEYVISVPLSVMEALACGVPVVAVKGVGGFDEISSADAECIVEIEPDCDKACVENAISALAEKINGGVKSLLRQVPGWNEVAKALLDTITADVEKANVK